MDQSPDVRSSSSGINGSEIQRVRSTGFVNLMTAFHGDGSDATVMVDGLARSRAFQVPYPAALALSSSSWQYVLSVVLARALASIFAVLMAGDCFFVMVLFHGEVFGTGRSSVGDPRSMKRRDSCVWMDALS
jgi:hypothetical protein